MPTDMDYFRLVRRSDPSYTEVMAIREWMASNPDAAVRLAEEIWSDIDPDSAPMDRDELSERLEDMGPLEAFYAGYYSQFGFDPSDDYFTMDEDGRIGSMDEAGYVDACVEFMQEDGCRAILRGDCSVPEELVEVLSLWDETVRTANRRPSAKCKGGCRGCGKPVSKGVPSKNRKTVRQSKNAKPVGTASKSAKSKSTKAVKRCRT